MNEVEYLLLVHLNLRVALGVHVFLQGVQSNHEFSNETSKCVNTGGSVGSIVSHIIDWHGDGIFTLLASWHDINHQRLLHLLDALLFLEAHTSFPSALLSSRGFFLLPAFLVLKILASLHLSLNRLLVFQSAANHANLHGVFDKGSAILILDDLQLDLLIESGDEVGADGISLAVTKKADI